MILSKSSWIIFVVSCVLVTHLSLRRQPTGTTGVTYDKNTVELIVGDIVSGTVLLVWVQVADIHNNQLTGRLVPRLNRSGYSRNVLKQTLFVVETERIDVGRNVGGWGLNLGQVVDNDLLADSEGIHTTRVEGELGLVELGIQWGVVDIFDTGGEGFARVLELLTLDLEDVTFTELEERLVKLDVLDLKDTVVEGEVDKVSFLRTQFSFTGVVVNKAVVCL